MDPEIKKIIDEEIVPLIEQGKVSLFVGAGFSAGVPTVSKTTIPNSNQLKERILKLQGYSDEDITQSDLGDAFSIGQDKVPEFNNFLEKNFLVKEPSRWQIDILRHWWKRIYTTNIDDCLNKGAAIVGKEFGADAPSYIPYNLNDRSPVDSNPTEIPLVTLHGTVTRISEGFIFDGISYADASVRQSDWLRDAALYISAGNCIFLGSQFNEPDIETALRERLIWETPGDFSNPNWIVIRNVTRAKKESYEKRHLVPLCCEIEDFCKYLHSRLKIITAGRFLRRYAPHIGLGSRLAGSWFVKSFDYVPDELQKEKKKTGIQSRFFSGDAPNWYYVANDVPAVFETVNLISNSIAEFEKAETDRVQLISIIGGVATGKTTACMLALASISKFNNAIYYFDPAVGIDIELFWDSLKDSKGMIVLYFDHASEYFYAINEIAKRAQDKDVAVKLVFLIEDRIQDYRRNLRHLSSIDEKLRRTYEMGVLSPQDGLELIRKLKAQGMATGPLDGLREKDAVKLLLDKGEGFRGDLLVTLCEVTSHESFSHKLRDEYSGFASQESKEVFETVCIVSSLRLDIPLVYLSEIHRVGMPQLLRILNEECSGKIVVNATRVSLRHSGIAEFIAVNFMDNQTKVERIIEICRCVSQKFTISEIRLHPLPYLIYKNVLSRRYLVSIIKGKDRYEIINSIYSGCQTFFSGDGIFWLQYGRFLENFGHIPEAIHCLRKGLGLYDSFQIRHALGDVLLKSYARDGGVDEKIYDEGIALFENELSTRGISDSYVSTTFVDRLLDISELLNSREALERARQVLNDYIKIHGMDSRFREAVVRFSGLDRTTFTHTAPSD